MISVSAAPPETTNAAIAALAAKPPKLLDRVRAAIRLRHYSRRTEEAYTHWRGEIEN